MIHWAKKINLLQSKKVKVHLLNAGLSLAAGLSCLFSHYSFGICLITPVSMQTKNVHFSCACVAFIMLF